MDKINIALSATEDNAAAIRELNKALVHRKACKLVAGTVGSTDTSFGTVTSTGGTGVVVTFPGDGFAELMFGNSRVYRGRSPILGILPAGTKELTIVGKLDFARALIIGSIG